MYLHDLEETEEGYLYERADGELALEAEDARSTGTSTVSALTLKDKQVSASDIPLMRGSSQDWGFRQIANVVRVPVETFTESSEIVLWISPQNIVLDAGRGTTILIEYPHEGSLQTHRGAASWVAPVSGTDYTAQSGLTVTGSVVGDRYRIVLANAGSGSLTVSGLQIRGKALVVGDPIYVGASDSRIYHRVRRERIRETGPAVQRHSGGSGVRGRRCG